MIKKIINHARDEKGFTLFEILITVALVSVSLLTLFSVILSINNTDLKAKEANFTKQLIDVYVSYYSDLEISKDELSLYVSDLSSVNLVENLRKSGGQVPKIYRDLDVICNNEPTLINEDGNDYILFTIKCEKDGNKINKGNGYQILKYVN